MILGRSCTINLVKTLQWQLYFFHSCNTFLDAAKRILERLGIQTSSFVKIPNFKANFLVFAIVMTFFYFETIGVH